MQRLPHNLPYMFRLRKFSFPGALYLLLTLMFPVAGLMYFVAPKVGQWLRKMCACGSCLGVGPESAEEFLGSFYWCCF